MITYTGVHIQKKGGVEGTPTPTDIAVHAGRICRFGGAVWYPLLPHLVFVGLMAYRRSDRIANMLWGFLHDAHEVATSDVPRPFKCDCMRGEQQAIDQRIFSKFLFPHLDNEVDFDLIKQCDIDAGHIEAVQLGIKGFSATELKYGSDYTNAKTIYNDPSDVNLFKKIMQSPFGRTDTISGLHSQGVTWFEVALLCAERRNYAGLLAEVRSWGLL